MKKNQCDVCGNEDDHITSLREIYQTEAIKHACPECTKILNKRLDDIRSLLSNVRCGWFKRFIVGLKARSFSPTQERIGG